MTKKTIRVAVLISGRGSNLLSLIHDSQRPNAPYEIVLVVSDRADAGGIHHATHHGIKCTVIHNKDRKAFANTLTPILRAAQIDLIALAGFMRILDSQFVERWLGSIINIHPSLLPEFPGLHPHQQALDAGASFSGCTVHYVIPEVDAGPIISQSIVNILDDDDEYILADRILEAEHKLYPIVIDHLARQRMAKSVIL